MANMQNIDYWEELLKNSPEQYKVWFELEKEILEKTITKGAKVLEVGCGEGRSLRDISHLTRNLFGVDNNEKAVSDAKENFKEMPSVKISLADGTKLPFENKTFEYIICMTTFANFGNKKYKVLEEMKRALRDKGKIIISVYAENALEDRLKMYKKMGQGIREITKNGKVVFDEDWEDNVSEQFSKEELENIFDKVGLKVLEIQKKGIGHVCVLEIN